MPVMGTPEGFGTKSVTVKMKDGEEYFHEVTIAKGMPKNPLTTEEFNAKFRDCASVVLDEESMEKSQDLLSKLQTLKSAQKGKSEFITQILDPTNFTSSKFKS